MRSRERAGHERWKNGCTIDATKARLVLSAALCWLVAACGSSDGSNKSPGAEGHPCYSNGTCNAGLSCFSEICVNNNPDGSTVSGGGSSSGGSTGSSGGGSSSSGAQSGGYAPTSCSLPSTFTCDQGCETLCENTNAASGCTSCPDCTVECCHTTAGGTGVSCGGACQASLNSDKSNCGKCGIACSATDTCVAGICKCVVPTSFLCSGDTTCLNTNCCEETNACANDAACTAYIHCKLSAPAGQTAPSCGTPDATLTKFASCATSKCPKACGVSLP